VKGYFLTRHGREVDEEEKEVSVQEPSDVSHAGRTDLATRVVVFANFKISSCSSILTAVVRIAN